MFPCGYSTKLLKHSGLPQQLLSKQRPVKGLLWLPSNKSIVWIRINLMANCGQGMSMCTSKYICLCEMLPLCVQTAGNICVIILSASVDTAAAEKMCRIMWVPPESSERSVCDLSQKVPYWWRQSAQNSGMTFDWLLFSTSCIISIIVFV